MDAENLPKRTTPYYGKYQRDIFANGSRHSEFPLFSTDPDRLRDLAEKTLSAGGASYADCNAGVGDTDKANREAFYRFKIVPRMLGDNLQRDISIELFGHKIDAPIMFSPIGINIIYNNEAEIPVAKVAHELNLPYCLSTAGSTPIERVGEANKSGPRFYQLYLPHSDELALSLLQRAFDSGFDVCMMTLDTWQLAWRHNDVKLANYAFYKGIGNDLGFSDPVFKKMLKERGLDPFNRPEDKKPAGELWIDQIWHGKPFGWDKIPWVIKQWKRISGGRPFLLKGIQDPEDAIKAKEMGCDGIVVSNHAGRQVDGAVGSLNQLAEIIDKTGGNTDKWTVLFDSGVRGGSDVLKALALGAKAVGVGRLWVWGLSVQGEAGVRHVMKSLLADFDILMEVAGFKNIGEINRKALRISEHYTPKGLGM